MDRLKDRVVLITGAAGAIGHAVAIAVNARERQGDHDRPRFG